MRESPIHHLDRAGDEDTHPSNEAFRSHAKHFIYGDSVLWFLLLLWSFLGVLVLPLDRDSPYGTERRGVG